MICSDAVEVEVDARLARDVDPEPPHRLGEALDEPVGRELLILARGAEEAREIRATQLVEPDPERSPDLWCKQSRVTVLACDVERRRLHVQAAEVDCLAVGAHLGVAGPAQRGGARVLAFEQLAIERTEVALGQLVARPLDRGPDRGVGFVGLHDRRLAKTDSPVVELDLQAGLALGQLGLERLGRLAEVPLDREVQQHPQSPLVVAIAGSCRALLAQRLDRPGREQLLVAVVDRLDLVGLLEPRVVAVVLAGEVDQERLGRPPIGLEIHRAAMLVPLMRLDR